MRQGNGAQGGGSSEGVRQGVRKCALKAIVACVSQPQLARTLQQAGVGDTLRVPPPPPASPPSSHLLLVPVIDAWRRPLSCKKCDTLLLQAIPHPLIASHAYSSLLHVMVPF